MIIFIINAEYDSSFGLLKRKSEKDLFIVCLPWGFSVSNFYKYKSTEIYKKFNKCVYRKSRFRLHFSINLAILCFLATQQRIKNF